MAGLLSHYRALVDKEKRELITSWYCRLKILLNLMNSIYEYDIVKGKILHWHFKKMA